ncbi:DUF423 domain-containing protein [Bosea sp. 124]|uniref:DUF423 domain-containing protein n=1 Tax=Bosea sp. 124 TaxID=2135642 RepID=UPI000D39A932|nr:DUF423 domain-containing protein [Bosea sp. 124]PTM40232.1 uncharacterized membrane protein YgdD (TMEM256/DUF423 family) [Bosea sp. 124]
MRHNAAKIHLTIAMLLGLAGVGLLAAGAHSGVAESVTTAGQMLLFHAPVVIAATAARKVGLLHQIMARIALSFLCLGVVVFAADLARRGFGGQRLFQDAAPTGGFLMMASWFGLALSALFAPRT